MVAKSLDIQFTTGNMDFAVSLTFTKTKLKKLSGNRFLRNQLFAKNDENTLYIMQKIEFYIVNDELLLKTQTSSKQLTMRDIDLVERLYVEFERAFPDAIQALKKVYAKSFRFKPYYLFKIVNRFCRCNFGNIDNVFDVDDGGRFNLEYVQCPLRGECKLENIVCQPRFSFQLSPSELRVMRLLVDGASRQAIADSLCLSIHTVNNHIQNSYLRAGVHSFSEFVQYASRYNLFHS